jgi:hypothetical protein
MNIQLVILCGFGEIRKSIIIILLDDQVQGIRNYMIADKALCTNSDARKVEKFIRWEAPLAGWVRLNTDGSCCDDGHIGCCGIIKGGDGEWLGGFAKFIGQGNAYVVELWGVFEGLEYAKRLKDSSMLKD